MESRIPGIEVGQVECEVLIRWPGRLVLYRSEVACIENISKDRFCVIGLAGGGTTYLKPNDDGDVSRA